MAITSTYKDQSLRYRIMTTEDSFSSGINYTNNTLQEGYVKTLINYDIVDSGNALRPRPGFVADLDKTVALQFAVRENTRYAIHSTGTLFAGTENPELCRYAIIAEIIQVADEDVYDLTNAYMHLERTDGTVLPTTRLTLDTDVTMITAPCEQTIKDVLTANQDKHTTYPKGVCASVNGNVYIHVRKDAEYVLSRVTITFDTTDTNKYGWKLETITPYEATPVQAVNYGYNMYKANPYFFANKSTETGGIVLNGIVPMDEDGKLLLSARPGAVIVFHLIYQYPTSDITNGKRYYVQWEMQDLNSNSEPIILQQVRKSPAYVPSEDITLRCANTPYKQFTVIAKIYYKDVVDDTTYPDGTSQLVGDANYLLPDQVITLASYSLTDATSSTFNTTPVAYNLKTAKGMCTWQQRLVMWGVDNATTTLFVSEINIPEYVPYPNNSEVFEEDIVACIPYLSNLLVFTHSKLYMVTMNTDGLSYKVSCIQDKLSMTREDGSTVKAVQNMVYFKSGNYFYLVVPRASSTTGDLQIAPISTPIEYLLDNLEDCTKQLIDDTYSVEDLVTTDATRYAVDFGYTIELVDFYNYLENKSMRNVYKWKIKAHRGILTDVVAYIDVIFQYSTILRVWTCYMYQANESRMIEYEPTVTNNSRYLELHRTSVNPDGSINMCTLQTIKTDITKAKDSIIVAQESPYVFGCTQVIDTGYRQHYAQTKKRFREIQFGINNKAQSKLEFYTGFTIDDDTRKSIYEYSVEHCTDKEDTAHYGMLYISRELCDPDLVANATIPKQTWTMDFSRFPDISTVKVRFPVSGKGYGGSVKIISKNESMYELLNMSWVYRIMYSR